MRVVVIYTQTYSLPCCLTEANKSNEASEDLSGFTGSFTAVYRLYDDVPVQVRVALPNNRR